MLTSGASANVARHFGACEADAAKGITLAAIDRDAVAVTLRRTHIVAIDTMFRLV